MALSFFHLYFSGGAGKTTELHEACTQGQLRQAKHLLESGTSSNQLDGQGRTPLHVACRGTDVALIRLLLKHQADPDVTDDDWNCALHLACANGRCMRWCQDGI